MPSDSDSLLQTVENPNIQWMKIFVGELAKGGLSAVCIAPGSRSTPLTLAFDAHPDIKVFSHLDERSAAFFALGMALADEKVVALVCTSGTAAANFHPAVIEAQMSQIPLLILTADRPHELRHSGANQTIDQVKMFGDHVLWSVDLALPQANTPDIVVRYIQTLAARSLAVSSGLVKGPVHINFPFRKPLEPKSQSWPKVAKSQDLGRPHTIIERGSLVASESQFSFLSDLIDKYQHGLIICGPGCPGNMFPETVTRLSKASGYPLLADPLSGVRFGPHVTGSTVIGGNETFLQENRETWAAPDVILRFGKVPTSRWLNEYLNENQSAFHVHVRNNGIWADGDYTTNYYLQVDESDVCFRLAESVTRPVKNTWLEQWINAEIICKETIANFLNENSMDAAFASMVFDQLPQKAVVFAGNSLAIRHIDQFCFPQEKSVKLFSNRGASGIDGNLSTGLGIAASKSQPVVLLVGDITFYHDSNGLLAVKNLGIENVIIILLNNNGGGIFRRLPVSQSTPAFEKLFLTPHGLEFEHMAKLYDLDYFRADEMTEFTKLFDAALHKKSAAVIEIRTDSQTDDRVRREIVSIVNSKITREVK